MSILFLHVYNFSEPVNIPLVYMQTSKIISDEADNIFTPSNRKPINTALLLAGGELYKPSFQWAPLDA